MLRVRKRDGKFADFDLKKIKEAMRKAFDAVEMIYNDDILEILGLRVTAEFQSKIQDSIIDIEDIQDCVEDVLEKTGYTKVAKAYILYRKNREKHRKLETVINYKEVIDNYLQSTDWRVKENSTVTYSVGGLILHNSGSITANYWLSEVYDEEIAKCHKEGDFHLHDLSMLTAYCAGWSLKQLIESGLGGVPGKITSAPAGHLYTIVNQMVNFLGIMQNEWAGAQAFSSFDTYLAPFARVDKLDYKGVKQAIQAFVFGVNIPSRWGTQAPFSNITLDWVCPDDLKNLPAIVGGKEQDFTYGECQKEMDMINKAFIEIMIEGDAEGRGFQYPIPTYNITKDFDWESENVPLLFEMTAKYGTPYFQNFINSDMKPGDVRSMCCRLQLDKRELLKKTGGLFGSGEKTGSIGVVTINMPRLAYNSKNKEEFFKKLSRLMNIAKRSLEIKRKSCTEFLEHGFYPYTRRYLGGFSTHFSTIGLVGMNEMCLNAKWVGDTIASKEGISFSTEVLEFMREELKKYQEETGNLYNLEATPAESTAFRLAKMDRNRWPDIKTAADGNETPFYTNSCHLPVGFTTDPFEALEIQDQLQTKFTGGTVFHTFLGERLPSWKEAAALVKKIAYTFRLPYFTISPTYTICPKCGYSAGEHDSCPKCGGKVEVYSRITGYYRPIEHWNDGKKQEFEKRTEYDVTLDTTGFVARKAEEPAEKPCTDKAAAAPQFNESFDEKNAYLLFTTKSCPNCPKAKEEMAGTPYLKVLDTTDNMDLARKYGVRSVPTLVVCENNAYKTYSGLSDIIGFKKNLK